MGPLSGRTAVHPSGNSATTSFLLFPHPPHAPCPRHRLAHARHRLVASGQLDRHRKRNEVVFPEFGFVVDALDRLEYPCFEWVLGPARCSHVPGGQPFEKALGIVDGSVLSFLSSLISLQQGCLANVWVLRTEVGRHVLPRAFGGAHGSILHHPLVTGLRRRSCRPTSDGSPHPS